VGLAVVTGIWAYALSQDEARTVSATPEPRASSPATSAPSIPQPASPNAALARLDDMGRPFTVAVIGDSTGAAAASWVVDVARWLNETYDRPVTLHPWFLGEPGYGPPGTIGSASGAAPVTIWNGSASGQNVDYSREHLTAMIPAGVEPDLIMFNHGHNVAAGALVHEAGPFVLDLAGRFPDSAVLLMTQNPETGDHAAAQDANMADWRTWAERFGFPLVDVASVFERRPGWRRLVDSTGVHPTDRGYALWAGAIEAWINRNG
jgi:hypothetical protein